MTTGYHPYRTSSTHQHSDDESLSDGRLIIDCSPSPIDSRSRAISEAGNSNPHPPLSVTLPQNTEKHSLNSINAPETSSGHRRLHRKRGVNGRPTPPTQRRQAKIARTSLNNDTMTITEQGDDLLDDEKMFQSPSDGAASHTGSERSRRSKDADSKSVRALNDQECILEHSLNNNINSDEELACRNSNNSTSLTTTTPKSLHKSSNLRRKRGRPSLGRSSRRTLTGRRGRSSGRLSIQSLPKFSSFASPPNSPSSQTVLPHREPVDNIETTSLSAMDQSKMYVSTSTWWRRNSKTMKQNADLDMFCWICHKSGELTVCSECPRVYHTKCLKVETPLPSSWLCKECLVIAGSETCLGGMEEWNALNPDQLKSALKFLIDHLSRQNWAEEFRNPVDESLVSEYSQKVKHPMDLRTLLRLINEGYFTSTRGFMAEFQWIVHNCYIFNNQTNPSLIENVEYLARLCKREISLIRACPQCYLNRTVALPILPSTKFIFPELSKTENDSKLRPISRIRFKENSSLPPELSDGKWFIQLCSVVHPLVWVRLEDYPPWPAKVLEINNDTLLVIFFGDYTSTSAPILSVVFHSTTSIEEAESQMSRNKINSFDSISSNGLAAFPIPTNSSIHSLGMVSSSFTEETSQKTTPLLSSRDGKTGPVRGRKGHRQSKSIINDGYYNLNNDYKIALQQLKQHVALIMEENTHFRLPRSKIQFSQRTAEKYYGPFNPHLFRSSKLKKIESMKIPLKSPQENSLPPIITCYSHATSVSSTATTPAKDYMLASDNHWYPLDPPESSPPSNVYPASRLDQTGTISSLNDLPVDPLNPEPVLSRMAALNRMVSVTPRNSPLTAQHNSITLLASYSTASDAVKSAHSTSSPSLRRDRSRSPTKQKKRLFSPPPLTPAASDELMSQRMIGDENQRIACIFSEIIAEGQTNVTNMLKSCSDVLKKCIGETFQHLEKHISAPVKVPHTCCDAIVQTSDTCQVHEESTSTATTISDSRRSSSSSYRARSSSPQLELEKFHENLLRAEIARQDQEIQRLRVLVDLIRFEMAAEMRSRMAELRHVWDGEQLAVIEASGKVWLQEVLRLFELTKQKQWCAACGNEAFFYCCWNTSYCNSTCQQHHWPIHMNSCMQPKTNMVTIQSPETQPKQVIPRPVPLPPPSSSQSALPPSLATQTIEVGVTSVSSAPSPGLVNGGSIVHLQRPSANNIAQSGLGGYMLVQSHSHPRSAIQFIAPNSTQQTVLSSYPLTTLSRPS